MRPDEWRLDSWLTSRQRVAALTAVGTIMCIAIAFALDSYSLSEGRWELGTDPWKNVLIPAIIAPPLIYFFLTKIRQLAIARHRLEVVASTDSLTNCLNRAAFSTLVEAYLEKFNSSPQGSGAMLIIDVDHFKQVNDNLGHDAGDDALRLIAAAIRKATRDVDLVARIGGEEFSVFLPGARDDRTGDIAERIRRSVGEIAFAPAGTLWPLSVSVGGATFQGSTSFSELYRCADRRLYAAKRSGRNAVLIGTTPAGATGGVH